MMNLGRNAEKRKAREAQRKYRSESVATNAALRGTWGPIRCGRAPKYNCEARMHMLANRRLRQCGAARG